MFDSNAMRELAYIKADNAQRAGGGGGFKVYNSSKAFDESRGWKDMNVWQRAVYEATALWRSDRESAVAGFRWDCVWFGLDKDAAGEVPF